MTTQMPAPLVNTQTANSDDTGNAGPAILSPVPAPSEVGVGSADLSASRPSTEFSEQVKDNSTVFLQKVPAEGIECIADRKGFYNQNRIEESEKFYLAGPEDFGSWFRCVNPDWEKARSKSIEQSLSKVRKDASKFKDNGDE